ncbi:MULTISPECIES: hypothetical protein [Nostocales]|nr:MULTISPECIES: hypothetical protein [Nostocales]
MLIDSVDVTKIVCTASCLAIVLPDQFNEIEDSDSYGAFRYRTIF